MAYHVGAGFMAIYAGTLNKNGDKWVNKSVVTDEAISAVAQYLLEHKEAVLFNYDGKRYKLSVTEKEEEVS